MFNNTEDAFMKQQTEIKKVLILDNATGESPISACFDPSKGRITQDYVYADEIRYESTNDNPWTRIYFNLKIPMQYCKTIYFSNGTIEAYLHISEEEVRDLSDSWSCKRKEA